MKKRWLYSLLAIIILFSMLLSSCARAEEPKVVLPKSVDFSTNPPADLTRAFKAAVAEREDAVLAFVIYNVRVERVTYSNDSQLALLWLVLTDPQTGDLIPSEPGLAIARRDNTGSTPDWIITMQVDEDWAGQLAAVPDYMLSEEQRGVFVAPQVTASKAVAQTFAGYKLPWASGQSKRLTQSIGHKYIYGNCPTCLYSFDFADGTQFPLLASKGGTVKYFNWNCPNNNHSCNNYIVLEDQSTNPTTYQLYLHMAYNTIPPELRNVGAVVLQGQYIGNVDNTGASTGSHLHFHVHTTSSWWWGTAQDITFSDVDINGGRPRMCVETQLSSSLEGWYPDCHPGGGDWFTSGNVGAFPPTAGLSIPVNGASVTSSTVMVGGSASDNLGVTRVDLLANWQGAWQTVGSSLLYDPAQPSLSFVTSFDLCAANIPNGPVGLAVRAYDVEGNATSGLSGLRTVVKNYDCDTALPSTCEPGTNEVALFAGPGYTGACEVFDSNTNVGSGSGWYTSYYLGLVGDNNAASIKVGSSVRAILYDNGSFSGRPNALESNDANLDDNRLGGNDRLSSLIVQSRNIAPEAPVIDNPRNSTNLAPTSIDSLVIAWWRGSAVDYYATLTGPVSKTTNGWITANTWSVGSLPAGSYTVTVQARNGGGTSQASKTFTVSAGTLASASPLTAPVELTFEGGAPGWTATGLWRLGASSAQGSAGPLIARRDPKTINRAGVKATNNFWAVNNGTDYVNSSTWGHDLTSQPITIPANGNWWMSFDSYTHTESVYKFWDQRLVQVAGADGIFKDVAVMWMDPQQYWQGGAVVNLNAYRGQTIRVRFHFDTVDTYYNNNGGWWIDNLRVFDDASLPGSCVDNPANDSLAQARALTTGSTLSGTICGAGDMDYFIFEGTAGASISIDVDAQTIGSTLDPYIYLLDASGGLVTEQDDEVPGQKIDPLLGYTLPASGRYYVMLKAWNHPGAGGSAYTYRIKLGQDAEPPSVIITTPLNNTIPESAFTITAVASDAGSGVNRVEFYYHRPDWVNSNWELLGVDFYGDNGYTQEANPALLGNMVGGAIYVRAVDGAGNTWGDLRVNLQPGPDVTPPTVALNAIPTPVTSTYLTLSWSGTDSESGIDHYELAYRIGSGDWTGFGGNVPATQTSIGFVADLNSTYSFKVRAYDRSGNVSAYSERSVSIGGCTADGYENGDDTAAGAVALGMNTPQEHNLCARDDSDWLAPVNVPGRALLMVKSVSGGAGFIAELYEGDGTTLLQTVRSNFGVGTALTWVPQAGHSYRVRIRPLVPNLAGTECRYSVSLGVGQVMFLPVIGK